MPHQKYTDDAGNPVDSVTTVLSKNLGWSKEALVGWARKLALQGIDPYKVRDSKAKAGTLAHELVEYRQYGSTPPQYIYEKYNLEEITKAQRCLDAYIKWESENEVEYIELEYAIQGLPHDLPWRFGGCCDGVWKMWNRDKTKKVLTIQDHKTGKGIYGDAFIQTCAYRGGIEYLGKYTGIEQIVLFHYDTEENDRVVPIVFDDIEEMDDGFEVFKGLCVINNARKWIETRIEIEKQNAEDALASKSKEAA